MKKLYKSNTKKIIAGVCGGIAEYFNIDPTIIRLIFCILVATGGSGIILYIAACIIMPSRGFSDEDVESMKDAKADYSSEETHARSDEDFDSYFNKK